MNVFCVENLILWHNCSSLCGSGELGRRVVELGGRFSPTRATYRSEAIFVDQRLVRLLRLLFDSSQSLRAALGYANAVVLRLDLGSLEVDGEERLHLVVHGLDAVILRLLALIRQHCKKLRDLLDAAVLADEPELCLHVASDVVGHSVSVHCLVILIDIEDLFEQDLVLAACITTSPFALDGHTQRRPARQRQLHTVLEIVPRRLDSTRCKLLRVLMGHRQ
ncbi:hypothetical protein JG688_00004993 [Phytophthora aleatoria]|uniref:Uncharacterized protein n=1 Tax=Phytophthora aleatoria TaxID=2496075 RepID=A0A8J5J075_9STRA|nr:hypothetical protein JG688_00004993 [Phytophthora aleatoria]